MGAGELYATGSGYPRPCAHWIIHLCAFVSCVLRRESVVFSGRILISLIFRIFLGPQHRCVTTDSRCLTRVRDNNINNNLVDHIDYLVTSSFSFSLPRRNSDPRSPTRLLSSFPTTVPAFIFIAIIIPHVLASSTRVELCFPTL